MASKRDELQSHQFLVQRVTSALVRRETDPEHPPFRPPSMAAFGSIAIAVLVLAGFWVYGMVVPGGNKAWRAGDAVIVEKETGTRYVYLDGRLHPVLNYTSALLALGKHGNTRSVSRNSLVGAPRGPRIGIQDAPDALPAPGRLMSGAWSLCSRSASDSTGATVDRSVLMVGAEPPDGQVLGDEALLVQTPDSGDHHLIWRGYRHRIRQPDTVTVGLALRSAPRARVGMAVLDVLPAGDTIAPITVAGAGEPSTAVAARKDIRAGQLLVAETSAGVQHYLAETEVLRPITELQYHVQLGFKPTAAAYGGGEPVPVRLSLLDAAEARQLPAQDADPGAPPPLRPVIAGSGRDTAAICATYEPGVAVPRVRIDPRMPAEDPLSLTARRTTRGTPLADHVRVAPGFGALVEVMPGADAPAGTFVIVTDQGRAHPLENADVAEWLGYGGVRPVRVPAALVARLPQGSGLGHRAALSRG
ncbi:type VII secretion protein EccB [Lentzea albidocapillata subsp. violacea]|uniref:Type VII secretion protein EccB n=1 Tax=Lentzea albidocapillata subsp. violacea TaxID=128104 RepID=A0A1G8YGP8_9PSEU|nr:type VII secretion protein EccB [Lentzea albidocapillata]SDK01240.1 type VII secretion protein EccB [Lentzea albidocapillata subsp. violacea]